jgi:hypothetical protein
MAMCSRVKDNVDNAKELFKSTLVDEATHSFRPPEPNVMRNVPLDDDDIDVQVCNDDDVFGMVNVGSPSQDIESRVSAAFNTATPSDLANEAFKEWILLKVDWLAWLLNEQKLDEIDKSKVRLGNRIYVSEVVDVSQWSRKNDVHHRLVERIVAWHLSAPDSNGLQERVFSICKHIDNALRQNLGNAKFEMLLILAFNKAFIKDMESKDLFTINNLIALLKSTTNATEAAANIIKYFDLDNDVKDDETDESMEIVAMLKSATCDIQQQHDANGSAIAQKRARNE